MPKLLAVSEVFLSVQGEGSHAGLPCVFVRLTGCPLRCSFCDTAYAFSGGRRMTMAEVHQEILRLSCPYDRHEQNPKLPLVELTGGEPLAQDLSLALMRNLCDAGFTVLLETSGALDITSVDQRVHRVMDLKCPSSGEIERNRWENLSDLRSTDEVKFVIASREDYEWAKEILANSRLPSLCPVLFAWATPLSAAQQDPSLKRPPGNLTPMSRRELVERLLEDALPVRFQAQLHKVIWPPDRRGV